MSIKSGAGLSLKMKLLEGIHLINDAVSSTLGPAGRNVLINNGDGTIRITKDGVTVAKSFKELDEPVQNIAAQLLKQVAIMSGDKAGDGTTTATLLAAVMIEEGVKLINAGNNPIQVSTGIIKAADAVIKHLKDISRDVSNRDQIIQVATVSANNDPEMGKMIAAAMDYVGTDGIVTIEESKTGETTLEKVEGMQLDRGYKSPYFVTNNNSMTCTLESPKILIFDGVINTFKQLDAILNKIATASESLLIVSQDVDHEALATLLLNKQRGTLKVCAVKAPDFGDKKTLILEDLAIFVGGTVLSNQKGTPLEKVNFNTPGILGTSRIVTVGKDETTIVDGKGDVDKIKERIGELKTQVDNASSGYEKERLQDRLAKLICGVAIINVGGTSEVEMNERKDRFDDSLHATKAAIEEGILPGGGMALLSAVQSIDKLKFGSDDESLGGNIVRKAVVAPFNKILENAGLDPHMIKAEIMSRQKNHNVDADGSLKLWEGYNVKTSTYENFLTSGVLDPTKVARAAIENAASIAATILTTESVIYFEKEKDEKQRADYSQYM